MIRSKEKSSMQQTLLVEVQRAQIRCVSFVLIVSYVLQKEDYDWIGLMLTCPKDAAAMGFGESSAKTCMKNKVKICFSDSCLSSSFILCVSDVRTLIFGIALDSRLIRKLEVLRPWTMRNSCF